MRAPRQYLLLRFEHGTQIVHLGMSGSLRSVAPGEFLRKHDHVEWIFDQAVLRLHDPRRFGAVLWHAAGDGPIEAHPLLAKLGIEPFDPRFDGAWLHRHFQRHGAAIKQVLLAGAAVVGVGNIYASESLFRARINPKTPANKLSPARCDRLAECVRATLADALTSGGSTCATMWAPPASRAPTSRSTPPSMNGKASPAGSAALRSNGSSRGSGLPITAPNARRCNPPRKVCP